MAQREWTPWTDEKKQHWLAHKRAQMMAVRDAMKAVHNEDEFQRLIEEQDKDYEEKKVLIENPAYQRVVTSARRRGRSRGNKYVSLRFV